MDSHVSRTRRSMSSSTILKYQCSRFTPTTLLPQENFEVLYEDSLFVEGSRHSARYKLEKATQREALRVSLRDSGRGERIRTSDLSVPNRAHYQAVLRPEGGGL